MPDTQSTDVQTSDTGILEPDSELPVMSRDHEGCSSDSSGLLEWVLDKRKQVSDDARRVSSPKASISHLPNEMLLEIFRWAQCRSDRDHNECISVSWVCQHWRAVALGAPVLWADVVLHGNVDFLLACLERSKTMDMRLKIVQKPMKVTHLISMIDTHATRIQTLELVVPVEIDDHLCGILSLPTPPMPNLTELTVRSTSLYENPRLSLQKNACPRLRILDLQWVRIAYSPNLFTGLLHITLMGVRWEIEHGRRRNDPGSCQMHQFLDLLQTCPLLESLKIIDHDEEEISDRLLSMTNEPERLSTVSLQRLQLLEFDLAEWVAGQMLSRLIVPHSYTAHLRICSQSEDGDFFKRCVLPGHISPTFTVGLEALKLCISRANYMGLEDDGPDSGTGSFDLSVFDNDPDVSLMPFYLVHIPTTFPSLRRLILAGDIMFVDTQCWLDTLQGLVNLVSLHVKDYLGSYPIETDDGFYELFSALNADSPSGPIVCPNLQELTLNTCIDILPETSALLVSVLDRRIMHNAPIKKLVLIDHARSNSENRDTEWEEDADLEELESRVESFTWKSY